MLLCARTTPLAVTADMRAAMSPQPRAIDIDQGAKGMIWVCTVSSARWDTSVERQNTVLIVSRMRHGATVREIGQS